MSNNWIVENIQNALGTWNDKLNEIWRLLTESPESFKGGAVWNVMVNINGTLKAVGYWWSISMIPSKKAEEPHCEKCSCWPNKQLCCLKNKEMNSSKSVSSNTLLWQTAKKICSVQFVMVSKQYGWQDIVRCD